MKSFTVSRLAIPSTRGPWKHKSDQLSFSSGRDPILRAGHQYRRDQFDLLYVYWGLPRGHRHVGREWAEVEGRGVVLAGPVPTRSVVFDKDFGPVHNLHSAEVDQKV